MLRKAPLPSSFMLVGILGFLITLIYWRVGKINHSWGFTLALFFAIIFISSLISLRATVAKEEAKKAPPKKEKKK